MGELQHEPFQFTFNGFLKVAFQGSRVTSDAGLILVRELDERLGLEAIMLQRGYSDHVAASALQEDPLPMRFRFVLRCNGYPATISNRA